MRSSTWSSRGRANVAATERLDLIAPCGPPLTPPVLANTAFTVGLGAYFLLFEYWGRDIAPHADRPYFLRVPTSERIFSWTIFQSFLHFYYDGFAVEDAARGHARTDLTEPGRS
ncbi:MAG: hypothetical protein K0V04_39250 [Deltaproteobacteria bacterium]|nr:hypothetical protein [Deltaproteobacteria bacterium]